MFLFISCQLILFCFALTEPVLLLTPHGSGLASQLASLREKYFHEWGNNLDPITKRESELSTKGTHT